MGKWVKRLKDRIDPPLVGWLDGWIRSSSNSVQVTEEEKVERARNKSWAEMKKERKRLCYTHQSAVPQISREREVTIVPTLVGDASDGEWSLMVSEVKAGWNSWVYAPPTDGGTQCSYFIWDLNRARVGRWWWWWLGFGLLSINIKHQMNPIPPSSFSSLILKYQVVACVWEEEG